MIFLSEFRLFHGTKNARNSISNHSAAEKKAQNESVEAERVLGEALRMLVEAGRVLLESMKGRYRP
jgi:hypothetical protein